MSMPKTEQFIMGGHYDAQARSHPIEYVGWHLCDMVKSGLKAVSNLTHIDLLLSCVPAERMIFRVHPNATIKLTSSPAYDLNQKALKNLISASPDKLGDLSLRFDNVFGPSYICKIIGDLVYPNLVRFRLDNVSTETHTGEQWIKDFLGTTKCSSTYISNILAWIMTSRDWKMKTIGTRIFHSLGTIDLISGACGWHVERRSSRGGLQRQ